MAKKLKKEPMYVLVYGAGSEVMHGSNYGQHIRIQGGRITFISIRHPKSFLTKVKLTASIAIDTFGKVLGEYREGERSARFGPKYLERWQQAFMNMPELKINEQELGG
jgi:hypothetical protein